MIRLFFFLLSVCIVNLVFAGDTYDVLRSKGVGFSPVVPNQVLVFPRDHFSHPKYRIEWWYLTANLTDSKGREWGVHWTLFRQAINSEGQSKGWVSNQVWMAHAALSTPDGFIYNERFARGGIGQAGVGLNAKDHQFSAWLDDWLWLGSESGPLPGELVFNVKDYQVHLSMKVGTPWVLNGVNGYSLKSNQGQASYYYSQPHISLTGEIQHGDQNINVSGQGWMDHEWSSQPLADNQSGWDWFSLHLEDGSALMLYRLRHDNGKHFYSGTWIEQDGRATALASDDIDFKILENKPVDTGNNKSKFLPMVWSVQVNKLNKYHQWRIEANDYKHWLNTVYPYWEGPIVAHGDIPGIGYMEITGR